MHVKNFFLLLIGVCLALSSYAQFGIGGTKSIKKVKNTELLVVLGYDEDYNRAMEEAITKYWTFNNYRFISGTQYKKYCNSSKYSFLMLFTIKDWAMYNEEYDDVGIVLGGNCRVGPTEMVAYANMMVMNSSYYKAECIRAVQMIQNYLDLGTKNNLAPENYKETCRIYNRNHPEMGSKQLVIQDEDLLDGVHTIEKVKQYYTHPVRFGGQSEVDKATFDQDEDFVYTKLIWDVHGYKYRCAIQAKDSRILYTIETQNREVILMGKRTLKEFNDIHNKENHRKFVLGF